MMAAVLLAVVGCGDGTQSEPGTAPVELGSIKIGIGVDTSYVAFLVGVEEGIFEKHGIDAEVTVFPSGVEALEAVLAGNSDIGAAAQFTFAGLIDNGGPFRIITQNWTSGKIQCAVATAEITEPTDLHGLTVATQFGGTGEYYANRYIERYELDKTGINLADIAYGQMVPAFAAGDMDAFFAFEPHCTRAVDTVSGSHILNRSGEDDVMPARSYVLVSEAVYTNHELAVAVARALVEAGEWTNDNIGEAAQIAADEFEIPLEDAERFVGFLDYSAVNLDQPAIDELQAVLEFYAELRGLSEVPDLEPYVATEFIEEARGG